VVNSHLVCDPIIWQPGFDLPRQQWSLLNCFRMEQGYCGGCRRKWRLTDTDLCPCGETQTMSHIVESCPDKTEWRLISATLCGWRRCFVADQLWLMTRIREEEDYCRHSQISLHRICQLLLMFKQVVCQKHNFTCCNSNKWMASKKLQVSCLLLQ